MKKFRKLIPALAMLLVSAVLMSTASYAWFSMNTQVTATGMKVKATAEKGIVISNSLKSTWSDSSNAQVVSATLYPTSHTATEGSAASSWVHNTSNDAEHAFPNQTTGYDPLTIVRSASNEGIGYVEVGGTAGSYDSNVDPAYYLVNEFYIKSSDTEITTTKLYVNDVTAVPGNTVNSVEVSLRVLVDVYEYSGSAYTLKSSSVYAPVAASPVFPTTDYNWKGLSDGHVAVEAKYGADHSNTYYNTDTTITTIPAYNTENPIKVLVYVFFEGEDGNCRTKNMNGITPNDLTVSVRLGTTKLGTDYTQATYYAVAQKMENITSSVASGSIAKNGTFTATYTPAPGYTLPTSITVKVNGTALTAGSGYTWDSSSGALSISSVTGTVEIIVAATH